MLVIDGYGLGTVHVLNFTQQVSLNSLFTGNPQNIVRNQRADHQWIASSDVVTRVNTQVLAVRHQVLTFNPRWVLDLDGPLATAFLFKKLNLAVDFCHNSRNFRPSCFKEFGQTRQARSDILRTHHFPRCLRQCGSDLDFLTVFNNQFSLLGDRIEHQVVTRLIGHNHLRVERTLVLHHGATFVARGIDVELQCLAFDQILELHDPVHFRNNRGVVRIPFAHHTALGDLLAICHKQGRTVRYVQFVEFTTTIIKQLNFAVTGQSNLLAIFELSRIDVHELHDRITLGLVLFLFQTTAGHPTNVECTHGQLSTWLANRLGCDDADRHALLNKLTCRKVHAIAGLTYPERGFARHRATNLNLLNLHLFELTGLLEADHVVLFDHHFIGDRIIDTDPADTTANRL